MMGWRRLLGMVVLCSGILVGCGGGGGGGGAEPKPVVDPNAPTFTLDGLSNLAIDAKTSGFMIEILGSGSALLDYAQFATDIAHRFARERSPANVTANCAYAGQVKLQFDDRDGNGYASAGDVISVTLDNCGLPVLLRAVSGSLQVQIVSATPTVDVGLQARLVIKDDLRIGAWHGPNIGAVQAATLRGSMDVKWSESSTGSQLEALSSSADDLRFTASYDGVESTSALRVINLVRAAHYDSASMVSSMAFLYDLGARGGLLRVVTKQPFQGDLNVASKQLLSTPKALRGG